MQNIAGVTGAVLFGGDKDIKERETMFYEGVKNISKDRKAFDAQGDNSEPQAAFGIKAVKGLVNPEEKKSSELKSGEATKYTQIIDRMYLDCTY